MAADCARRVRSCWTVVKFISQCVAKTVAKAAPRLPARTAMRSPSGTLSTKSAGSAWMPLRAGWVLLCFTNAAPPADGERLYDYIVQQARAQHPAVATGRFGANMKVWLMNDGPVTTPLRIAPAGASV